MVKSLYGKKIGMTRLFLDGGNSVPVTLLKAGPCVVIQKKTKEKDGYEAIQVGFEPQKETRANKPLRGHFARAGDQVYKHLREIKVDKAEEYELGQSIGADVFNIGDVVHVTARSKGRGFAGVIKRWGFSGGKETHGSRSHRVPGSIGASATPGRVYKGRKLPGRMGNQQTTIKNLKIVDVRPELDIIAIKGSVPGPRNSIVRISMV
ncbi:MAG: 50S ribosomal protein L3 [Deltaproteobacteria bacterium]|nr:50S ribosomal protein L3 [Deltaproteobacteria bacterium]MBW2138232.1 50S ribosomal protein L3 [Deltaproteobacteria bacterium]